MSAAPRLLLVANMAQAHLGVHMRHAAEELGLALMVLDTRGAWASPVWLQRLSYHLAGRRPSTLGRFSREVLEACSSWRPTVLLSTGIAPPEASALRAIRALGVRCLNFLSDDPWNPANRSAYFWDALREYDVVHSPRTANLEELRRHGCRDVRYLPFGYDPALHFPERELSEADVRRYGCDVAFVGGADRDRVELLAPLLASGLRCRLYGNYWSRFAETRAFDGGVVLEREMRAAVAGAKLSLCMGRAANRDGHAMRTFELPAMAACMLVEDTAEHRELFGDEDVCVSYYESGEQLAERALRLCADGDRRARLASAARERIAGAHTYAARLKRLLAG
jgi:spore maturation protein CgeB